MLFFLPIYSTLVFSNVLPIIPFKRPIISFYRTYYSQFLTVETTEDTSI